MPGSGGEVGNRLPGQGENPGNRLPGGGENISNKLPGGGDEIGNRLPGGGENVGDRLPGGGGNVGDRLPARPEPLPANPNERRDAIRDRLANAQRPGPGQGDVSDRMRDRHQEFHDRWQNRGDEIRDRMKDRRDCFNDRWWDQHTDWHNRWPHCWHYHNRVPYGYWWRPCTWVGLTGWFGGWWATPYYYDYGSSVYYENNVVYVNQQPICSVEDYAQQAITLAESVPAAPPQAEQEQVEWMPLGTFALSPDSDESTPQMYMQFAVNKDGVIAGTYTNAGSDSAKPIQGQVDRETQRAVWYIGDNTNTVLETGIYNFTQDQATVLVHFGTEKTQNWLMVRLEDPESSQ